MAITLKTHKMLWGRAGNRCAICKKELVMDATETDDASIVGEACHIVAKSPSGPRGKSVLTECQRDKYNNLILLCSIHHKVIDDQVATYSVDVLVCLKTDHEQWVRDKLGFDDKNQQDDEIYAAYVEEWADRMQLNNWTDWASSLISSGQPTLHNEMKVALDAIPAWLLSRIWPSRYPELESAFLNFRRVAQDLSSLLGQHAIQRMPGEWETEKFYRLPEWNPERYQQLVAEYEAHVALVEDLALELTRAANYVCDKVRCYLMRSYRINEGALLIEGGPYSDLSMKTYRVEYNDAERTSRPYPGLNAFRTIRFERDYCFGARHEAESGASDDGL